jgi:hypothetical protein
MTRSHRLGRGPALVLGSGIIVSTTLAVLTSGSAWTAVAGPLLCALSLVGADVWGPRLCGASSGPSREALVLAGALLVGCGMIALTDPASLPIMVSTLGGSTAAPIILLRAERRRDTCGGH